MKFYTYAHYTTDTNEIFYIGKGCGNRYKKEDSRNKWWERKVSKHGFSAKILAYWPTEKEAYEHEIFLIACFKDMGKQLVNIQSGGGSGSGYSLSAETKGKLSEAKIGSTWSAVRRQSFVKRPVTDKQREALNKGRSAENSKKSALSRKGLKRSLDSKERSRQAQNNNKKVICVTTGTIYHSIALAALELNIQRSDIRKVCSGHRKTAKGLTFMFIQND